MNQTIIRTSHSKEKPYVVLSKNILHLTSLSWEAKGLWGYLMSLPDDWEIRPKHLMKAFDTSRDRLYRIINELIENGLCSREQPRNQDGTHGVVIYTVFEEQIKKCLPRPENTDAGKNTQVATREGLKNCLPLTENTDAAIYMNNQIHKPNQVHSAERTPTLSFNFKNNQFEGITVETITNWQLKFSALNIVAEIEEARAWVEKRPARNRNRRNWIKFFENEWFIRADESEKCKKSKEVDKKQVDTQALEKLKKVHALYRSWYEGLSDPFLVNRGFLSLGPTGFYDSSNPTFIYKPDVDKFLDLLGAKYAVPASYIKIWKSRVG